MARSIILRFDAQCVDCGATLSAGTTARWFGRGRVSCCGAGAPAAAPPAVPPAVPPAAARPTPPGDSAAIYREALRKATDDAVLRAGPSARSAELIAKANQGLTLDELSELAATGSAHKLMVFLKSGAQFMAPAYNAAHLCRCIEESCVDRVRVIVSAIDKLQRWGE